MKQGQIHCIPREISLKRLVNTWIPSPRHEHHRKVL